MEIDFEVIRNLGHAYLPHVYNKVSLSVPLKGHHVQPFQIVYESHFNDSLNPFSSLA